MREILFRGKSAAQCTNAICGQWLYGNYIIRHIGDVDCHYIVNKYNIAESYIVDANTVGQYTGLKDKNGNRIFEGDILQFGTRRLLVYWNDEAFQWQAKTRLGHYTKQYDACPLSMGCNIGWDCITLAEIAAEEIVLGKMSTEIIGNVFDNPDLLKDDKPKQDIGWEEI